MGKKIQMRHPDGDNRADGGVFVAESELEARQAQAIGYRRDDGRDDGDKVPPAAGEKQATKAEPRPADTGKP